MTSWFKQGLSSLGEGLATLTKEIISEEPADAPRSGSSKPSRSSTPLPLSEAPLHVPTDLAGDVSETNHLRIISDLEERARTAEASAIQNQQLVKNYEAHMINMRDQIYDLQNQLDQAKQKGDTGVYSERTEDASQRYFDVDLSKSPSPIRQRFSSQSEAEVFHSQETALENSRNLKLLEERNTDLELEVEKKDETIDELNEEVSTLKNKIVILQWQIPETTEKSDVEIQVASDSGIEVPIEKEVTDMCVQTDIETTEDLLKEAAFTEAIPSSDKEHEIKGPSSFCLISMGVNDGSSQTSSSPEIPSVTEVSDQVSQCDTEELRLARSRQIETVDKDVQVDDFSFEKFQHVETTDQEMQCNTDEELPGKKETLEFAQQTERSLAVVSSQTSQEEEPLVPESSENETQTEEIPAPLNSISTLESEAQWENSSIEVASGTDFPTGEDNFSQTESFVVPTAENSCQFENLLVESADAGSGMDTTFHENESQSEMSGDVVTLEQLQTALQQELILRAELEAALSASERLKKEGERLRAHLVKVEQAYAQDFETVQVREDELRKVIEQLQGQVLSMSASQQQSSSEITEHVSRLQEQLSILNQARDEAVAKLYESEKRNHQLDASLSNLRMAVEHSKKGQQADLAAEREKSRKILHSMEQQLQEFQLNNSQLVQKVFQLEKEKSVGSQLLVEVEFLRQRTTDLLKQLDEKDVYLSKALDDAATVSSNKVDKALLRSMVFGYFAGPKSTQNDILRMMMLTLDFSDTDKQKVQAAQTGGLRSLFASSSTKPGFVSDDTFGNMLVKFIEQESRPKGDVSGPGGGPPAGPPTFPSAAGLFDSVTPSSSSRRSTPVGVSSFLTVSDESAEKQDQVLRKILDAPSVPEKISSVDTV